MELGTIHHAALYVQDYDRSKKFYVNKLGFRVLGEYVFPSGTRRLDCVQGDARLELFWNRNVREPADKATTGWRHLCFRVTDIEKTVAWLEEQGIATDGIREDPMAGGRMTFFYDPDGFQLELHE